MSLIQQLYIKKKKSIKKENKNKQQNIAGEILTSLWYLEMDPTTDDCIRQISFSIKYNLLFSTYS